MRKASPPSSTADVSSRDGKVVIHAGVLQKKLRGIMGGWKTLYCEYRDNQIFAYVSQDAVEPHVTIKIDSFTAVVPSDKKGESNWFGVISSASTIWFQARDESERNVWLQKLSPKRMNQLTLAETVETMVDAVVVSDAVGNVLHFNSAAERLFGYSKSEVVGKLTVISFMPEHYARQHDTFMQRYLMTGVRRFIGTPRKLLAVKKDSSTVPVELSIGEVQAEAACGARFIGVFRVGEAEHQILRQQQLQGVDHAVSSDLFETRIQGVYLEAVERASAIMKEELARITARLRSVEEKSAILAEENARLVRENGQLKRENEFVVEESTTYKTHHATPIEKLLKDKVASEAFYQFLVGCKSAEGLLFYRDVESFKQLGTFASGSTEDDSSVSAQLKLKAQQIIDRYLAEGAEMELNIRREDAQEIIAQCSGGFVRRNMFTSVQLKVLECMNDDLLLRFRQTGVGRVIAQRISL